MNLLASLFDARKEGLPLLEQIRHELYLLSARQRRQQLELARADAIRRLRAAAPLASVDDFETANSASFLPPETAADMNATFRSVWEDTPVTA